MSFQLPTIVQFIGGLAILIFLHELGHFLAARLFKVEVEEFGFGFPPRLIKLFQLGQTQFTLNWIPLGGFVRIKGENDPSIPGGLAAASPWVRLVVFFAGPLTNLALGVALSILLFYNMGEPILGQVEIQGVSPNSPAEIAGLQVGDLILEVNDQPIHTVDELHTIIYANLGRPTRIEFQRGGQNGEVTLVPRNPPPKDGAIGIIMGYPTRPISWAKAIPSGVIASFEYTRAVLLLPVRILQGKASPEEGRPVGYKGMYDIYQQIQNPTWFFMVISLSLGIFNLFPIPALDGGRILFTLPEILFRRRIPPKYETIVHLVGFVMLLFLLLYINLQDFINPIELPK